jgi:hypothetical protein
LKISHQLDPPGPGFELSQSDGNQVRCFDRLVYGLEVSSGRREVPSSGHDERTAFDARKSEHNLGDAAGIPDYAHTLLSIALEVFLSLLTVDRKGTVLTRRKTDMAVAVDEAG